MNANSENFGDRLAQLMRANGMNAPALADLVGVSPTIVRRWLKLKECTLGGTQLLAMALLFKVRVRWLCLGVGERTLWTPSEVSETELLRLYRILPNTQRELLIAVAVVFARKSQK